MVVSIFHEAAEAILQGDAEKALTVATHGLDQGVVHLVTGGPAQRGQQPGCREAEAQSAGTGRFL